MAENERGAGVRAAPPTLLLLLLEVKSTADAGRLFSRPALHLPVPLHHLSFIEVNSRDRTSQTDGGLIEKPVVPNLRVVDQYRSVGRWVPAAHKESRTYIFFLLGVDVFFPFVSDECLPEPIPAQPSRTPPAASVSIRRTCSPAGWRFTACLVCDITVRAESIIVVSIKLVPGNSLSTTASTAAWKDAAEGGRFNETGDVQGTLQESENLQERRLGAGLQPSLPTTPPGPRLDCPAGPDFCPPGLDRTSVPLAWTGLGLRWAGPDWEPAGL